LGALILLAILEVPPRTRGCTLRFRHHVHLRRGSPAHAGMHPSSARTAGTRAWFPRARGDAPQEHLRPRARPRVPPRTRGCTRGTDGGVVWGWGSPAHAGMHPSRQPLKPFPFRVPLRTRGCTRADGGDFQPAAGSPRTRGCTGLVQRGAEDVNSSPRSRGCPSALHRSPLDIAITLVEDPRAGAGARGSPAVRGGSLAASPRAGMLRSQAYVRVLTWLGLLGAGMHGSKSEEALKRARAALIETARTPLPYVTVSCCLTYLGPAGIGSLTRSRRACPQSGACLLPCGMVRAFESTHIAAPSICLGSRALGERSSALPDVLSEVIALSGKTAQKSSA
jgi:hypothetical protein